MKSDHPNLYSYRERKSVKLGNEIAKGGEGKIYEILNDSTILAKIYHEPPNGQKLEKIKKLVEFGTQPKNSGIFEICAWPKDILFDQQSQIIVGFIMPKIVDYDDIHLLTSPKSRKQFFTSARWKFLVYTALNVSLAFKKMHELGVVVGDINHGSVMVSQKAMVKLVDCDSFQFELNGKVFTCDVGTDLYTPPELQGEQLENKQRTTYHDSFGLAVLIFQLLFIGRHPFAGKPTDNKELTPAEAIKEVRFAYGEDSAKRKMMQPPGTPVLEIIPFSNLFRKAFLQTEKRPRAKDWVVGLESLIKQVNKCKRNNGHEYWNKLKSCPWCEIEKKVKFSIFGFIPSQMKNFSLSKVWSEIEKISQEDISETFLNLQSFRFKATEFNKITGRPRNLYFLLIGISIIVTAFITFLPLPLEESLIIALVINTIIWILFFLYTPNHLNTNLIAEEKKKLEALKVSHTSLPKWEQELLDTKRTNAYQNQLNKFLSRYRIDEANISGIGPARTDSLLAGGVETAADIPERGVWHIYGIGGHLSYNLVSWRKSIEKNFVFNPNQAITQSDKNEIEQKLAARRFELETSLLEGLERIKIYREQPERISFILAFAVPTLLLFVTFFSVLGIKNNVSSEISKNQEKIKDEINSESNNNSDEYVLNLAEDSNSNSNLEKNENTNINTDGVELKSSSTKESGSAIVIALNASLRSSSGTDGLILENLSKDAKVKVLLQKGPWFKVSINETTGWLHGNTIRLLGDPIHKVEQSSVPNSTPIMIDPIELNTKTEKIEAVPSPEIFIPNKISKGVLNDLAISLPKPVYPSSEIPEDAKGAVSVSVTINKSGIVISANAISGHPRLRQSATDAAMKAKFKPTLIADKPVEVTGVLVYKFE